LAESGFSAGGIVEGEIEDAEVVVCFGEVRGEFESFQHGGDGVLGTIEGAISLAQFMPGDGDGGAESGGAPVEGEALGALAGAAEGGGEAVEEGS
jgi:hypothetical protein